MNLPAFNPVALKELRQFTRTRLVGLVLVGFPALLFMLSAICLSASSQGKSAIELIYGAGRGEAPFTAVVITTAIVTAVIIPLIASAKTATETAKDRQGLEFTTTLTPSQIVDGKILAPALLATALIAISMPFLAFAYLLRGVTLSYVFTVPLAILLVSIGEITLGLPAALSRRMTMPIRSMGVIAVIPVSLIIICSFSAAFDNLSVAGVGIAAAILVILTIFMRGLAVLQISPPFGDSERPLRTTTTILFVLSAGFFFIDDFETWVWTMTWIVCGGVLFFRSCFTFREMPRIVCRRAPRSHLARLASYPFATGPAAGQLFTVVMLGVAVLPLLIDTETGTDNDGLIVASGLAETVALAWVVSGILRRCAKRARSFQVAQGTTILYLIIVNLASGIIHDAAQDIGFDVFISILPCNFVGIARLLSDKSPLLAVKLCIGFALAFIGCMMFVSQVRREFSAYRRHD